MYRALDRMEELTVFAVVSCPPNIIVLRYGLLVMIILGGKPQRALTELGRQFLPRPVANLVARKSLP